MKRFFLPLLSLVLLSTSAWADNVLFKMTVVQKQAAANVTFNNSEDDLGKYAVVIGATAAKIGTTETSNKTLYFTGGYIRLDGQCSYLHITLPQALKVGDKINMKKYENNEHSLYFLNRKSTRDKITVNEIVVNEIIPGVEFTVSQELVDRLDVNQDGSQDLYFCYGSTNGAYVTDLTITGDDDPTVKIYPFMDYAATTYAAGRTTLVEDELEVISSGAMKIAAYNGVNAMQVNSESGKTRYLKLNLTDPGLVEFWCLNAQSDGERTLRWYKNAFSSGNREDLGNVTRGGVLTKITKRFEGLKDNDSVCIVTSADLYIVAIRVIYDKIRPAADLAISPASITVRTGNTAAFRITTSSNVNLVRTAGAESSAETVKFTNLDAPITNPQNGIDATVQGKQAGSYIMVLTQAASADYRAARVEFPITISDAVNVDAAIASNTGTISGGTENNGPVWTSTDGNITLIYNGTDGSNWIRPATFAKLSNALILVKDYSYTISVPSNKTIKQVTFRGYTNNRGTDATPSKTKIEVNSAQSASELPYIGASGSENEVGTIVYEDLSVSSFTFKVKNYGMGVVIDLVVEESNTYPLTIAQGWASFCAPENVALPSGLTAYRGIEGSSSEAIMLEEVESNIIPRNRGFIIGGADGSYNLTATTEGTGVESNLGYTVKRTPLPSGTIYCLNGEIGAFQQYNGEYIPANKAYYRVTTPKASAPRAIPMRIVQKDNTATSIENTEFIPLDKNAPVYNLQGQQVQITTPGIYVQNGHKYLILQ